MTKNTDLIKAAEHAETAAELLSTGRDELIRAISFVVMSEDKKAGLSMTDLERAIEHTTRAFKMAIQAHSDLHYTANPGKEKKK